MSQCSDVQMQNLKTYKQIEHNYTYLFSNKADFQGQQLPDIYVLV